MIEELLQRISQVSILQSLGLVFLSLVLYQVASKAIEARRIAALGRRAPRRRHWIPFGLQFIYRGVKHARQNKNYEFWLDSFMTVGNKANPYTVEANVADRRVVFTADPENIKAILATQFADYGKGENFNQEWRPFLGNSEFYTHAHTHIYVYIYICIVVEEHQASDQRVQTGIFTTDHERWHDSRQLIRPQFIKDRLSDLDIFEDHLQVLITKFGSSGQTIDICDLFFRYTLDAAMDFLLGSSVDSLSNPQVRFASAFGEVQHIQSLMSRMGPIQHLYPKGRYYQGIKIINEFCDPFIDETLRLTPQEIEKRSKSDSGYTFLHALAGYTRDRTVLRDQLVAILLAGRDTTACTLSWLFYEMSKQPKVVEKLRTEIRNQVGFERRPEYTDLKAMKYLQHCLNETLRLYPVVPFNVRESIKDTTLPRGGGPAGDEPVGILKGTPIGYSTLVMQRREDLYPPQATGFPPVNDFVPERWDGWNPKPWTYIPFNGGPRLCVGQQFALTEMAYTVTRILQRYERVETRMNGEEPGWQSDIVLQPAKGVRVALYESKKQ